MNEKTGNGISLCKMKKKNSRLCILFVITISLSIGWSKVQAKTSSQDQREQQVVVIPSDSLSTPQVQTDTLRVAISPVSPFAFHKGEEWTGFSIDLWDAIAKRLGVNYEWIVVKSRAEQLEAVQSGKADIAMAAVPITPEWEQVYDFSVPYFDSGLQIMVSSRTSPSLLGTLRSLPYGTLLRFFALVLVIVFVLAHVLLFEERRNNPNFPKGYLRGLSEALWGVMMIIATGEHGDRDAPNIVKRLMVAFMWLLGIVFVAQFTATVTSSLTVKQLQSTIQGPGDLPGKTIATVTGSIAAQYLTKIGMPYTEIPSALEGLDTLRQGKVQAIVFEAPTLQYLASTRGGGVLQVVGPIFQPQKYAIATMIGSPLRKQINEVLLTMYQDGSYEEIHAKYFSVNK
jgi:polar amino acid transport system substrate-binding protein